MAKYGAFSVFYFRTPHLQLPTLGSHTIKSIDSHLIKISRKRGELVINHSLRGESQYSFHALSFAFPVAYGEWGGKLLIRMRIDMVVHASNPSAQREMGSCCSKANPKSNKSQFKKKKTIRIKGDVSLKELRSPQRSRYI